LNKLKINKCSAEKEMEELRNEFEKETGRKWFVMEKQSRVCTLSGDYVEWLEKKLSTAFINEDSHKADSVTFEPLVMPPTAEELRDQRDYATCHKIIEALATMVSCTGDMIIDKLTGYLWKKDEADKIKAAMPIYKDISRNHLPL
jgi:hypothetical protein